MAIDQTPGIPYQRTFSAQRRWSEGDDALIAEVAAAAAQDGLRVEAGTGRLVQQGDVVKVSILTEASALDVDIRD